MENETGYRLSLKEIIFLSASMTQAKTIFGLRNKSLSVTPQEMRWDDVKSDLLAKQLLRKKEDGSLAVCSPKLGQIIYTVSHPKVLAAIRAPRKQDQSSDPHNQMPSSQMTRFYIQGLFTVTLDDDPYEEDYYLLRAYAKKQDVQAQIQEMLQFDDSSFTHGDAEMVIDIPTFDRFMKAVRASESDTAYHVLHDKGLSTEHTRDLYNALAQRNNLLSYVIYAFDPAYNEGRRTAKEVMVFGGDMHMWKLVVADKQATISVARKEYMWHDLDIVSRLMDFI